MGRLEVVLLQHACEHRTPAPEQNEGIAAANVELAGTEVGAVTIHSLFDLDGDTHTHFFF